MKYLFLLLPFISTIAVAQTPQCMTATLPVVYDLCSPPPDAVGYDWFDEVSGVKILTTDVPRIQISQVFGPIKVYAVPFRADGSRYNPSDMAIILYATKAFGWDGDGNGSVNAGDFGGGVTGIGFTQAFNKGCMSCAAKNAQGTTICECPALTP